MKKKEIEKIPFLTVPATVRSKTVKYIAVTVCREIGGKEHIFLEVYRNRRQNLKVPAVRYVATENDWGVYFPESGIWTRQKIKTDNRDQTMCWDAPEESGKLCADRIKSDRLYSPEDLQTIKNFFNDVRVLYEEEWWSYFEHNENAIRRRAEDRKYRRRAERLKERETHTPPLPEQEILEWADKTLFKEKHFLYYRKKNRRAAVCCSKCGGITEGKWKAGESYEAQFEHLLEEPIAGSTGICPLCGAVGEYKPQGKAKSYHGVIKYAFRGEKYREKGAVIRYIQIEKSWELAEVIGESGKQPEMLGAYERLSGIEIARSYFEPGKKVQTDFNKHNPYTGKDFWDDCNLYGMNSIPIKDAVLYPDIRENLKGTILQYSAIELYVAAVGTVNAADYMKRYMQTPQIEMLVKLKLYGVVKELVRCRYGICTSQYADRPEEFLGIRKDKVKLLMEYRGDIEILKIMQIEKRLGQNWTETQIIAVKETGADQNQIKMALSVMTLQKVLNIISKYAECEYGTGCSKAEDRIRHTAATYFDYLSMRVQLGYDLHNTVYQRPRNLEAAHNRMVIEINKEEQDKRLREVAEKYPEIRKNYRKLRNRYFYEDDIFIIRPAGSAEEIVQEGRILHQCVGGDYYLSKHSKGESTILMLRFREEPDIPYITVEIADNRIIQWYGAHDKKPDMENMQKWLDAYVTRLKCKTRPETGPNTEARIYA